MRYIYWLMLLRVYVHIRDLDYVITIVSTYNFVKCTINQKKSNEVLLKNAFFPSTCSRSWTDSLNAIPFICYGFQVRIYLQHIMHKIVH